MKVNSIKKNKILHAIFFFLICDFFVFSQNNSLDLYEEAVQEQNSENYYTAQQLFLEVVSENPAFSDAWFGLSECCFMTGENELALKYLEEASKFDKNSAKINNLRGMILLSNGQTKEAEEIFNLVLSSYPNDLDARFGLAEIELYNGKFSGAENQYEEALKRNNSNRKALLSLSVVCAETGRKEMSERYLNRALSYYSGESSVHYLAGIVSLMNKNIEKAERHARIAVEIDGSNDDAYSLLAEILYSQKKYSQTIDICDYLISRNVENSLAWYLKGLSENATGNSENAIISWQTGLNSNPQDEIMRSVMEDEIRKNLSLEDERRNGFADFHVKKAEQYMSRYDTRGAVYEYQRALRLDPTNTKARISYAEILELNGMYELYLEQLNFAKENQNSQNQDEFPVLLDDKIEAYDSLLKDTIAKKWNVDSFYLDKVRWNIDFFYMDSQSDFIHSDLSKIVTSAAADIFSGVAITSVRTQVTPVSGFGEAFRKSRANGSDYFVMISANEGKNDIRLDSTVYSGRTGSKIQEKSFYGTGNDRFSLVLRRFRESVLDMLVVRGKILDRNGKILLVDVGKSENMIFGAEFQIVAKGSLRTNPDSKGLVYNENDSYGKLILTNVGEEVSEAEITEKGFYDRINTGDEIVLLKMPENETQNENNTAIDTVANSDNQGNQIAENATVESDGNSAESLVQEIRESTSRPSVIEILRNIR